MDGLVFDLNDCLVDRSDVPLAVQNAVEYVLEENELPFHLSDGFFDRGWLIERGKNKQWLFDFLLMQNGVPYPERSRMVKRCLKYYTYLSCKSAAGVSPFEDTSVLKRLNLPLAIVTNTPMKVAKTILRNTELGDYFDRELVFANGNKVRAIRTVAEDLGSSPNELGYVGDASNDICVGRIVGARTVAIDRGHVPIDRILKTRPNLVIKNLAMIKPWLTSDRFY